MPARLDTNLPEPENLDDFTWKPLRLLTFYRVILAGMLVVLFFGLPDRTALGADQPTLYLLTSSAYLVFSLVAGFTTRLRRPGYEIQVHVQVLTDIAAVTLLMHASGGTSSGLGILLLIAVATGSILLPGRMAFLFAAIAAMAILGAEAYRNTFGTLPGSEGYTQTGLLGIALFGTAGLTYLLTRRIYESEMLARRRGIDIANLAKLNAHIVQRLHAGIIVTDHMHKVRLINERARQLLEIRDTGEGRPLEELSPVLYASLLAWRRQPEREPSLLEAGSGTRSILPHFTLLGTGEGLGVLSLLEDTAAMVKQTQQIKLASLGRLTASIAHEIRNPLGAIGHAAQLLEESEALTPADLRLTSIISEHTRRVNTVVENVLQLSRPGTSLPQHIRLRPWLDGFVDEFTRSGLCHRGQISYRVEPEDLEVYMDPSLLHQVVWNICQNAASHGDVGREPVFIRLLGGHSEASRIPYLDIIDNGPGVATEIADQIFEPFFTTGGSGTGLGLYIAREICESNQAQLQLHPVPGGGSRFRITFPDADRLPASVFA